MSYFVSLLLFLPLQNRDSCHALQIKVGNSHAVSRLTSEERKCPESITGIKFRDDFEFHYEGHKVVRIKYFYLLHKLLFHLVDWYRRHLKHWPKIHTVYLAPDQWWCSMFLWLLVYALKRQQQSIYSAFTQSPTLPQSCITSWSWGALFCVLSPRELLVLHALWSAVRQFHDAFL